MSKQTITTIWLVLGLILIVIIVWLVTLDQERADIQNNIEDQDQGIEQIYDNKIVYKNTADSEVIEKYKEDCQQRDGQFQECGNPCAPDDEMCVQVCAYTCIFNEDSQDNSISWLEYENDNLGFSLTYPENIKTEVTQAGGLEFQLLGPSQQANTEIYDGLRLVISDFSHDQNVSLKTAIENRIEENILPVGQVVEDLSINNQYDLATYDYSVDTLGEFKHVIFPVYAGLAFDISYYASDAQYENIAQRMIKTFEINNPQKISTEIEDLIIVNQPKLAQTISSPLELNGQARGYWFFENQFNIVLADWDGRIIAETQASSDSNWMTEDFIDFKANLEFEIDPEIYSPKATLILQRSNPSGLPENDQALEYQVYLDLE